MHINQNYRIDRRVSMRYSVDSIADHRTRAGGRVVGDAILLH